MKLPIPLDYAREAARDKSIFLSRFQRHHLQEDIRRRLTAQLTSLERKSLIHKTMGKYSSFLLCALERKEKQELMALGFDSLEVPLVFFIFPPPFSLRPPFLLIIWFWREYGHTRFTRKQVLPIFSNSTRNIP